MMGREGRVGLLKAQWVCLAVSTFSSGQVAPLAIQLLSRAISLSVNFAPLGGMILPSLPTVIILISKLSSGLPGLIVFSPESPP